MTAHLPQDLFRRARGVLIGAAVGDALGWPQEQRSSIVGGNRARTASSEPRFRSWQRNSGSMYARYLEDVSSGEYSDDTQMLCAVARSCVGSDWYSWFTNVELPVWPVYQRGGGGALLRACRSWSLGMEPWVARLPKDRPARYFAAGGNGAAMRIAPHVIVSAEAPETQLIRRTVVDAAATHGHARALVGATLYAIAMRYLLKQRGTLGYGDLVEYLLESSSWKSAEDVADAVGKEWLSAYTETSNEPWETEWESTVQESERLLRLAREALSRASLANDDKVLFDLGAFDKRQNGAGTVTAVSSVYLTARWAARPMSALLRAAHAVPADSDTLASMTGALLGALHGDDWIGPELINGLQDSGYLMRLADACATTAVGGLARLASESTLFDIRPSNTFQRVTDKMVHRWKDDLFSNSSTEGTFLDGRSYVTVGRQALLAKGDISVNRIRLNAGGQSVVIDKVTRTTPIAHSGQNPVQTIDGAPDSSTGNSSSRSRIAPESTSRRALGSSPAESNSLRPGVVAHVTVIVQDLERSVRFYQNVFGLEVRRLSTGAAAIGQAVRLRQDLVDRPSEAHRNALVLLTILVRDLEGVGAAIERFGGRILRPLPDSGWSVLRAKDPDGYVLQIEQM